MRTLTRTLAALSAITLAACSADRSVSSSDDGATNLEVAQVAAANLFTDLGLQDGLMTEASGGSFSAGVYGVSGLQDGGLASLDATAPANCTPVQVNGGTRYDCGATRSGSRTFTRSITFYDGDGNVMAGYDSVLTARIAFSVADTGSWSRSAGEFARSDSSARARAFEVSNLLGHPDTLRIWNGTGTARHAWSRSGPRGDLAFEFVASDSVVSVQRRLPRVSNPWPVSGTVIRNVQVTRTATPTDGDPVGGERSRRVVITFDGSSTAQVTVNGQAFTLNLETGVLTAN